MTAERDALEDMRRAAWAGGWNAALGDDGRTGTYHEKRDDWERCNPIDQALANPATGDADDDALREAIKQALAHRYGDWTTILENALASSPAEPREASGYCPFCMTADPVSRA